MSGINTRPPRGAVPLLPEALRRERLFAHLDESRKRPLVWIAAPAGAGKTTLAASYLQARSLPALWYRLDERDGDCAAFFQRITRSAEAVGISPPPPPSSAEKHAEIVHGGRAFFEQFFAALPAPGIVVFEDYQHVPADSPLHQILTEGGDTLPPGVNLLITGRTLPPPCFSRHFISRRLALIPPEQLAFTFEETEDMARLLGCTPPRERLEKLLLLTGGWGAGITLSLLHSPVNNNPGDLSGCEKTEVFDYLSEEVFSKTGPEVQDFLLRISFLTSISAPAAERLTGLETAAETLSFLVHRCCFIEKLPGSAPTYRLNPLFRIFLQRKAERTLGRKELARLCRETACLLKERGEVEEAVDLYLEIEEWEEVVALMEEKAEALVAAGHSDTVHEWLRRIPRELWGPHPRIPFWLGLTLATTDAAGKSLELFRRAFEGGIETGDQTLTLLSWSWAVDSHLRGQRPGRDLDPWIEWLFDWERQGGRFPSSAAEARTACSLSGALTFRNPGHPSLEPWLERALSLTEWEADLPLRFGVLRTAAIYYLWMGRAAECTMATEALRNLSSIVDLPRHLSWNWLEVVVSFWAEGRVENGLDILEKLRCSTKEPSLSGNLLPALGVWGHLLQGNLEMAERFLDELKGSLSPSHPQGHCHYHYFAAWHCLRARRPSQARLHAMEAVRLGSEAGAIVPTLLARLALAQVLAACGEMDASFEYLQATEQEIDQCGSRSLRFIYLLACARVAFARQNREEGLHLLRQALQHGAREGYSYLFAWWEPEVMSRLCIQALEGGIEITYVQDLVRRCRLMPDPPPIHLSSWPWSVKVYTLGRFNLLIEGVPVRFSGKIQQKPLDLLKALIALGGRNVAAQQICDLLWPEADGDAAQAAFSTTLHRLRKLVRHEGAIRLSDSKLSLDPRLCWVDTWAFQRRASEAEDAVESSGTADSLAEAIDLYTGNFLVAESYPWVVPLRERLRGRFLRLVRHRGDLLKNQGDFDGVMKCYTRGLDADPLSEDIYQNLIRCCRQNGRHGEAASIYHRCCEALAGAGLKPSARTLQLLSPSSPKLQE